MTWADRAWVGFLNWLWDHGGGQYGNSRFEQVIVVLFTGVGYAMFPFLVAFGLFMLGWIGLAMLLVGWPVIWILKSCGVDVDRPRR